MSSGTRSSTPRIEGLFGRPVALQALLDDMPIAMAVLDASRRIVSMNRALEALSGFGRDRVHAIPCRDVLRSSLCLDGCPAIEALETGESVSREGDLINRERQKISIRVTTIPLKDDSGRPLGFLEIFEDTRRLEHPDESLQKAYGFGRILGRSPRMEELFRILPVIAQTDSSVLITGETGTGKDLLAETVHQASGRAREPFVKVNCGALPETLLESELFGHTKGAFTGAVADKPGRLRLAHRGTLYLTEIGDLPLPLQVKLLTFLDDKVVHPLGGTKGFQADVRIIAATHRDLEQMVLEGRFRKDLLYRLNVVRLHLPPLHRRPEDIDLFMDHFLPVFSSRFGKKVKGHSKEVRALLARYPYPGNVRELRNIVEYAVNVCQGEWIEKEHLPAYLTETRAVHGHGGDDAEGETATPAGGGPAAIPEASWPEVERRLIMDALVKTRGRRKEASELLGWCRSTLWRKMKLHGIDT